MTSALLLIVLSCTQPSKTEVDGGVQYEFVEPCSVARVTIVAKPYKASVGDLKFTATSLCLGETCVKYPRGSLTERSEIFWLRDGKTAVVRGISSTSMTGSFPKYADPPQVRVDFEKRTLKVGKFPLFADATPCELKLHLLRSGPFVTLSDHEARGLGCVKVPPE